jgi:hypothetical protein
MPKTLDILSRVLYGAIFVSAPLQAELLAEKDAGLSSENYWAYQAPIRPHYLRLSTTSYVIRLMRLFSKV